MSFSGVVLANAETGMKSKNACVLHKICGRELVNWVIDALKGAGAEEIAVIGSDADKVSENTDVPKSDLTVVVNGAAPLVRSETIAAAVKYHTENESGFTVISGNGNVIGIIVNGSDVFADMESMINAYEGKKSEYIAVGEGVTVTDRVQLSRAESAMHDRIIEQHMLNGVTMRFPESVYIEYGVEIGADTEISGSAELLSGTKIGKNCIIGPGSRLDNAVIGDNVDILSSVILNSEIESGTHVGPFAYVRPNCKVGKNVKVGDFVEIKNSVIDDGTKISHLTYIGDSDVGKNVNFGCGTVTCNYDGKKKFRSRIGDNTFVGCNTNLVSPVDVGDRSYIAAGSTITNDIPEGSLSIARARQVNKEGWADEHKKY